MKRPSKRAVVAELESWIACITGSKREFIGFARNGRRLWKLRNPEALQEIACLREAIRIVKDHYDTL